MALIRLTPSELHSFASKLRTNQSESIQLAESISNNIKSCADSWEGNQREKFVSAFENIKPTLSQKLPELIEEMAKALDTIATNFEQADQA